MPGRRCCGWCGCPRLARSRGSGRNNNAANVNRRNNHAGAINDDADVSTSVGLADVQIQLFRMFHDPQPFDSAVIGDMAAGDTYSTRFLVDGGFTYSIDVIAGTEFVAGAVDGMNPCVASTTPPLAPVADANDALPSTR